MQITRAFDLTIRDFECEFDCAWQEPDRETGFAGGWECRLTGATAKQSAEIKLSRDDVLDFCGDAAVDDAEYDAAEFCDLTYGQSDEDAA